MVDEVVKIATKHLVLFVAEHFGSSGIDDSDVALQVHTEDAVAYRFEDGVGLAGESAEAAFGTDLLADVDAEAEDVAGTILEPHELVAVGDDTDLAIAVAEVEQALGLTGIEDEVEVGLEGVTTFSGMNSARL